MNSAVCGLCGHRAPEDHEYLGGEADGVPLCHQDDHSCYHRWTVYGMRPGIYSLTYVSAYRGVMRGESS
jgi:hypothetical protein